MNTILDWKQYEALAARACAEGAVLLRNEHHALPLGPGCTAAVFGRIQNRYYKSGTGSGGMVNVSHVTDIPEGLTRAGIRLHEGLREAYRTWEESHPADLGSGWGAEPWNQAEMPLTEKLVEQAALGSDAAVVILGRTAGEEQDNRMQPGSYLLTDEEERMLRLVRQHFSRMIVLVNTGNLIDLSFLDTCAPDALLLVWHGGMTGGTGAAMVLTGEVSPCGKLPDTAVYRMSDHPADKNFGGRTADVYEEDIYVGYRYFETFDKKAVRFPFGFGLSYTSFSIQCGKWHADDAGNVLIDVTVTNTGDRPGREVVQIYCEAPQGALGKPARVLTGFHKTRTLAPGEREEMQLPLIPPVSYDDSGVTGHAQCFVLEAGSYRFYVGSDVRSASPEAVIELPETVAGAQRTQVLAPVQAFRRMRPEPDGEGYRIAYEDVPTARTTQKERLAAAPPAALPPVQGTWKLADVRAGRVTLEQFVASLPEEALCSIVRGEGMGSPRVTPGTASAFGGVTKLLEAYGIPAGCCSDGPSGMRLDCGTKAFSLPCGTLLAATWDEDLLTQLYTCMGLEMRANRVDCLLGPGMNIHRHPLNGRNFEYFSEDPLLTGKMAAAQLKGLHSAGVTGTIKHFCGNNQETARHFLDSVVSERALREIYLHGFEIAVKEGGADSVMTTYGSLNGLWTAGNYDLCTTVLREEWGFTGFVMTDWWANINAYEGAAPDKRCLASMVRAQNDVYMVCADSADHDDDLMQSLRDGTLSLAALQRSALNICRFLLGTRAMDRLVGEEEPVTVTGRPGEEESQAAPVIFHAVEENYVMDGTDIPTQRGTTYSFALDLRHPGWYRVTLTAACEGGELAQVPVTLFSMGTASGTFTWSGTNGDMRSFEKTLPLFSRYTTMRLYFAQSGLTMRDIRFERLDREVDMGTLAETEV
ncbi:MAG: glycoside hydrolase family 3 protein [Oscillospiraceae bacterium]|nr:glycoside hydrolase family 3 protein [Oscillospiraceae bacterium]